MAEQSRKVGARIAELRSQRGWEQKHLVARMAELGDTAINTNQLSRYENGGALPREKRLELFAEALDTTIADLQGGPAAERKAPADSPFDQLSAPASSADLARVEQNLLGKIAELGAEVAKVQAALSAQRESGLQSGRRSAGTDS